MHAHATTPSRLTGRRVLLILVGFFGTVASADAFLVTSALRTWSGLEVASPYHAGQIYNADFARAHEQVARGWHLESAIARVSAAVTLDVVVRDKGGDPLAGKDLRARLERPTDARADRSLVLTETAPGRYAGRVDALPGGQWRLVVEVRGPDGVELRRERRLTVD